MEEIGRATNYKDDDFPFLRYVTTSWVAHTQQCDERSIPEDDLLALLAWLSNDLLGLWARVYRTIDRYSDDCPQEGTTLVYVVLRYGFVGVLMAILQRADPGKADVNMRDGYGQTLLSWAAENGHEAAAQLLLHTGKVDVDARDENGQTPLSRAAEHGHEALVQLLLDTGKVDINTREQNGRTPLSWAAENGHEAVVQLLLDTGKVDVDARDWYGLTPLLWAP